MNTRLILYFFIISAFLTGCSTTSQRAKQNDKAGSEKEMMTALQSVAGSVSGQEVDEEKLKELANQIENDEEARSAVESVTNALGGKKAVIKYCPLDGKRYSGHLTYCPGTKVPLRIVEP